MDDFDGIETANDEWDETLEITSKGNFKASIPNIEIILRNDPNLKGKIAFNEFTKQIECLGKHHGTKKADTDNGKTEMIAHYVVILKKCMKFIIPAKQRCHYQCSYPKCLSSS